MRIGAKMMLLVMSTSVLIMLIIAIFIGSRINRIAKDDAIKIAQAEAEKSANEVKSELELDLGFARAVAHTLEIYNDYDSSQIDNIVRDMFAHLALENRHYFTVYHSVEFSLYKPNYPYDYGRRSTTVYVENGEPKFEIEARDVNGNNLNSSYYLSKTLNCEKLVDPYTFIFKGSEVLATSISVSIKKKNGEFGGLGGVDISLEHFQELVSKIEPYKGTKASLIGNGGVIIAHTNSDYARQQFSDIYPVESSKYDLMNVIKKGKSKTFYSESNSEEYLNIITPIHVGKSPVIWSMYVSIPMSQIVIEARRAVFYTILVFILGVLLQALAIWRISKYITSPIKETTAVLNTLAEGDIDIKRKVIINTGDELEEMARSSSRMIDGLNLTEQFAREIESGNLDAEYAPLSQKDALGKALLAMRKSLVETKQAEAKRKKAEERQNWATQGIAMFGEVLRQHNDNLNELSYLVIKNLVSYTSSIQGGIFIVNDNDPSNIVLEMTACYAYDRRKFLNKTIQPNEGMVGRCYIEGKTIFMRDIPQSYIKVTSGLGEENPSSLVLIPLRSNDTTLGVVEIASFNEYEPYQVEFLEKIGQNIAITLASVKMNIRTSELLVKTQQQAEEMRAQEEEMRQNMEELHATQEEMERKRAEQDDVQNQLLEDKSILNSLLNESPDLIFQKDVSGRYVRVSRSMVSFFNVESVDDILQRTDYDLLDGDQARMLTSFDTEVNRRHEAIINRDVKLMFSDNQMHSCILTMLPLVEDDGTYIGVLGIIKIV